MTGPGRSGRQAAPAPDLALPRGRRPIPTGTRLRTRSVPVAAYVAALLVLPSLVVAGSMGAGWWATTGTTVSAVAGGASGDGEGDVPAQAVAPADVKGSMTVQQVVDAFPAISAAQILAEFGAAPSTSGSTQLKTLVEAGDGMDIPALRTWLTEAG